MGILGIYGTIFPKIPVKMGNIPKNSHENGKYSQITVKNNTIFF